MKEPYLLRVVKDIYVDFINHTVIKNGLVVKCKNDEDSLTSIINTNKSIIRWGDGESLVLMGVDIHFQESVSLLRKKLLNIINTYSESSPYYICLPDRFLTCTTSDLKKTESPKGNFYQMHKNTRYIFFRKFPSNQLYLSHYLFKLGAKSNMSLLLSVFDQYENYIVIKSDKEIVDKFFSKYLNNCDYEIVPIPNQNAFSVYDDIFAETIATSKKLTAKKEHQVILISAGPCAKVLAHDLALRGYVAYDIGKFFESVSSN